MWDYVWFKEQQAGLRLELGKIVREVDEVWEVPRDQLTCGPPFYFFSFFNKEFLGHI